MELVKHEESQKKFELAVQEASNISLVQNASSAYRAVIVVQNLRESLTDEIMKTVFMPLMNTKIGFLTDRNGKPDKKGNIKPLYDIETVRDCIIDAACFGLLPTFNQFNIIAGSMYPTKEGYTARLKQLGVKYIISCGADITKSTDSRSEIQYKINYEYEGEKHVLSAIAVVPKTAYSSYDQQKGKAERRAKKALFEYITGLDLGDSDQDFTPTQDLSKKEKQSDDELEKIKL